MSPSGRVSAGLRAVRNRLELSLAGVVVAGLAAWASLLPSLLPRTWFYQGLVTGISLTVGYLLGWLLHVVWVRLVWPRLTLGPTRVSVLERSLYWLRAAAPYALALYLLLLTMTAIRAQDQVADLVGAPRPPWGEYMLIPVVALAVFAVLVTVARLLRRGARRVRLFAQRRFDIPVLPARIIGVVVIAVLILGMVQGVLPRVLLTGADQLFSVQDSADYDGVTTPTETERSGGPDSLVSADDLGMEGRRFVDGGLRSGELSELLGQPAREPIRLYAGLDSADTDTERASLVVEELDRTDAAARESIVVAPTTGTGWINPHAAQAIELLSAGDVAIVGTQYSHLPSWISFLADRETATRAGAALVDAVVEWRDSLPEDSNHPDVFLYGESLGTQAGEAAFTGLVDLRQKVDGVLWLGPPNSNRIWSALVERRDPGTTAVEPVYADGLLVRFSEDPSEFRGTADPHWIPPHILYVQHATDPVVWWNPDLLFSRPDWLAEPPGRGRHPDMRFIPVITFWQVSADLGNAVGASAGYGHDYDSQMLDGWAAVTSRPGWDDSEAERFTAMLAEAMEGQP